MKKLFLLLTLSFFGLTIFAQTSNDKREKVYIDYFSYSNNVSKSYVDFLRNKVIEGIQQTGRVILIDVDTDEILKKEAQRRQSESAMGDQTARSEQMKTLGAKYLIQGHIASATAVRQKDDKGNTYYKGSVSCTLKLVDPSNGVLKNTETFTFDGLTGESGETQEKAILKTIENIAYRMDDYVNANFKIEGAIVQISEVKKEKAKTVYINLGSAHGMQEDQKLGVFVENNIAGNVFKEEIGQLNITKVLSEELSLCKVLKGDKEIYNRMKDQQKLIVITKEQTLIGSFLKIF